jgi:hypothetical protein
MLRGAEIMKFWNLTIIFLFLNATACSPEHISGDALLKAGPDAGKDPIDLNDGKIHFSQVIDSVFKPVGCLDCHKAFSNYSIVFQKTVVAGSPEKSKLFIRSATDMPPIEEGYLPMSDEQLEFIKQWILQGALE